MTQASTSFADGALATRLNSLPKSARDKREHLRRVAQRMRAMSEGLYDQMQRAREARDHAVAQLSHFDRRYRPDAAFTYEDDPQTGTRKRVVAEFPERKALLARVEATKAELLRLQDEQAGTVSGFNLSDIDDYLMDQHPSRRFIDARVSPKLVKGETFAAALAINTEAQVRISEELARVRNAPRTIAEVKALMRQQVAALADKGKPEVAELFRGRRLGWPTEQFLARGVGAPNVAVSATVSNAAALTIWANQEAIIFALDAEIEQHGDDKDAISAADQVARVAECEAALLHLQRECEALIERAENDGLTVRRTCIDPLVLLGIERVNR